jgi:hypothetical protein
MKSTQPIWDKRMLLLMRHCIDEEICETQRDFLESVGFNPNNIAQLRNGPQNFTIIPR